MISNIFQPVLQSLVKIDAVAVAPIRATLTNPFPIASDASKVDRIDNVIVRIKTAEGILGYGEAAPYYGISGDLQQSVLADVHTIVPELRWTYFDAFTLETMLRRMRFSSSRAAVEMAFLDALSKRAQVPLTQVLHPAAHQAVLSTDITIPLLPKEIGARLAHQYAQDGFRRWKIKVGNGVVIDFDRIIAVAEATHSIGAFTYLVDANEGYSVRDAIELIRRLAEQHLAPQIFEQPVRREDVAGLKKVRSGIREFGTAVFADEAVYTAADAERLAAENAVDGFNLKIMKHGGLLEALRIAAIARRNSLNLMIGGMVETRLAMTASLHLAHAIGNISWLDLDTPYLLSEDSFSGGLRYQPPSLYLPSGHGIGVGVNPNLIFEN
ncbi:MAG: dipeptide epimerase [Deltaproteobacteria bacterium]|nr:dipeptide epimerase [Deltaproteobacteria bacterium]